MSLHPIDLLWYLVSLPGRLRRAWVSRQHAALVEGYRALALSQRVADELRREPGPLAATTLLSLPLRPRTVAEVARGALPVRPLLSWQLRVELWPHRESGSGP